MKNNNVEELFISFKRVRKDPKKQALVLKHLSLSLCNNS